MAHIKSKCHQLRAFSFSWHQISTLTSVYRQICLFISVYNGWNAFLLSRTSLSVCVVDPHRCWSLWEFTWVVEHPPTSSILRHLHQSLKSPIVTLIIWPIHSSIPFHSQMFCKNCLDMQFPFLFPFHMSTQSNLAFTPTIPPKLLCLSFFFFFSFLHSK